MLSWLCGRHLDCSIITGGGEVWWRNGTETLFPFEVLCNHNESDDNSNNSDDNNNDSDDDDENNNDNKFGFSIYVQGQFITNSGEWRSVTWAYMLNVMAFSCKCE